MTQRAAHARRESATGHRIRVAGIALAGTALLGASLSTRPAGTDFYALTAATAATWTIGGLATTPRTDEHRREPVLAPIATGVAAFGVFYGCALVARRIPFLRKAIAGVLRYADRAPTPPVLLTALANGAAEEVFFRGAVYAAAGPHPIPVSSAIYVVSTAATRNPALVLAAAVMGPLLGLERRRTGGVRAPILIHLTWSTLMIHYLPPLFLDESR
ncbi:CPBP family intramembrane glutamic endopeptidase [Nocardia arizonensis]|uniref:CPBP family intramembrane glutamic endopeptidase n=1 Tax=Nocardia arizonensis TaxID=1141647 RepID=UPI001EF3DA17|nr:CPBP family intramembrane glutamic endopeptidase [Nocardia arizonensis]